jgi:formylglycine-generating enzyme required for sulfatase activity
MDNIEPFHDKLLNSNNLLDTTHMVKIEKGKFIFKQTHGDDFIAYPPVKDSNFIDIPSYWIDKYLVTNADFYKFTVQSNYKPTDTVNYLKHWVNGIPLKLDENKPVVYISYEDAEAYANWNHKSLPSEIQWQFAAQTPALNEWPWKQEQPVTREVEEITGTLSTVNIKGIDSSFCNLGNGILDTVGSYPKGVNANGLYDLVGSVWQLTNNKYVSGSYEYIIMKGGSYFKPAGSWWYVQAGPRELTYAQYLLRVSQGFERNGTVGFRCVGNSPIKN